MGSSESTVSLHPRWSMRGTCAVKEIQPKRTDFRSRIQRATEGEVFGAFDMDTNGSIETAGLVQFDHARRSLGQRGA